MQHSTPNGQTHQPGEGGGEGRREGGTERGEGRRGGGEGREGREEGGEGGRREGGEGRRELKMCSKFSFAKLTPCLSISLGKL